MNTFDFRTVAYMLEPYVKGYDLLSATDVIVNAFPQADPTKSPDGTAVYDEGRWVFSHQRLVERTLDSITIMNYLKAEKKILAIKELRSLTGCGLKEAKDAVEDQRVTTSIANIKSSYW